MNHKIGKTARPSGPATTKTPGPQHGQKNRNETPVERRQRDWSSFEEFCRRLGVLALPAVESTVLAFMDAALLAGVPSKEVARVVAVIGGRHAEAGLESPTKGLDVLRRLMAPDAPRSDTASSGRGAKTGDDAEKPAAPGHSDPAFASGTPGPGPKQALPAVRESAGALAGVVDLLREVPEEEIWLQGQRSEQTRRAYRQDVRHFIRSLGIRSSDELRRVDRAAVVHWVRLMQKGDPENGVSADKPRTIRRRMAALSSLFSHLVEHRAADHNPLREIKRPRVNRKHGVTRSLSVKQARKVLDAPSPTTLVGLRDRALLAVGLQVGARRAEIASLKVGDFHQDQGFWSLHFIKKGGEDHSVSVHPQVAQRIQDYLVAAGHGQDRDGPLFRPFKKGRRQVDARRALHPEMVAVVLRKYLRRVGDVDARAFSAHSMRATFITTALENGASLEDVQRDVGHADATTTKLYDRRGHNPEKSASFFANY